MARAAGRAGAMYINLTSGGTAEPFAFLTEWSLDFSTSKINMTAMQDANMIYVSGLPDAQASYKGWYDTATVQSYTAATDGVPRKFYLYPVTTTPSQYFFGTMILDASISATTDGGIDISGSGAASSIMSKVG